MNTIEKFKDWQDATVDNVLGGLVADRDSELLDKSEFTRHDSFVIRNQQLKLDTGYRTYLGAVRGAPRRQIGYVLPDGNVHEILITNDTVYRSVNSQWRYISDGVQTTLTVGEAGGSTAMDVASIAGFSNGDHIGVVLDNNTMHMTTINGAPGGGVITLAVALPSAAGVGKALVKAVVLGGISTKQITTVAIPWNEWLVFTNGINNVKRFDPGALTVVDVPGLTNTVCQTLALFDNSLIIANLTESGTQRTYRYKYSAKGDATNWTTLEAGTTDLLDEAHDIMQALNLGPYLILYRDKSIARVAISGNPDRRFENDTTVHGVGVFSNQGVVDLVDKHIVWANNDFYWYQGGFAVEPIASPVKDYVFGPAGTLTGLQDARGECFTVLLPRSNEVLFFHQVDPTGGNEALRYYLDYNKWGTRTFDDVFSGYGTHIAVEVASWDSLPNWDVITSSWAGFIGTGDLFDIALLSAEDNTCYLYDYNTVTDGGAPVNGELQTKDFSDPTCLVRHNCLTIGVKGNGTLTVHYSTDKGQNWNLMGTAVGGPKALKTDLFKQFVGDSIRFKMTTSDLLTITYYNMEYKYEFEW